MFRTPLAIIAWPARSVWVFSTRGTDGAHLEIVEVTPGTSRPRTVWQGDRRLRTRGSLMRSLSRLQ